MPTCPSTSGSACRAWRFGRAELAAVAAAHPRARGLVRVRAVLDLMDPLAESLPESRLRVGLVLRGVPRPVSQFPVHLPGGRGARLDLGRDVVRVTTRQLADLDALAARVRRKVGC